MLCNNSNAFDMHFKIFYLHHSPHTHTDFPSDTGVMWLCTQQRADTVCVCFSFLLTNVSKSKRNLIQFLPLLLFCFFLSKKHLQNLWPPEHQCFTYTKIGIIPQKNVRLIVSPSSLSLL